MLLSKLIERITTVENDMEISFVTDDSRKVQNGCAFVCIKGNSFDGHTAALQAEQNGASVIIAERDTGAKNQVIVPDTRRAYSVMCAAFYGYPSEQLKLIGLTGTNGKTTSAFLIKDLFEHLGHRTGLIGTVQNMAGDKVYPAHYTTPDSQELQFLFSEMVKEKCEYCVMEVSSQALAQGRVDGCHFDIALFTNLTQDHLDYHGTFENYLQAKKILFKNADKAVLNIDDPNAMRMVEDTDCSVITFSTKLDTADYTAKNIRYKPYGVEYELVGESQIGRVKIGIPGGFSVYNSMGAFLCALAAGYDFAEILSAIAESKGVKGRIEVVPTNTDYTVIIDYAHSPDGLENILSSLREFSENRIICVFGCGGDRDKTKRPIMGHIVSKMADVAVVTSDNPRSEDPKSIIDDVLEGMREAEIPVHTVVNRAEAIRYAMEIAEKGDIVLLAGKGHETYQVLNTGKIHFDEREIVNEILVDKKL